MDAIFISDRELKAVLSVADGIAAVDRAFAAHARHGAAMLSHPPAMFLNVDAEGSRQATKYKVKGAHLPDRQVTGFRLIADAFVDGRYRTYDTLMVYDDRSATTIAIVDATWLGFFRTALTGLSAIRHLANPAPRVATVFGAGRIASQFIGMLDTSFEFDCIRLGVRSKASGEAFVTRHRRGLRAPLVVCSDPAAAIGDADVVVTLTTADRPFVMPGMLKKGALLCSMGGTQEIALAVLDEVDLFVVDDVAYARDMGDIAGWIRNEGATAEAIEARVDASYGAIVAGAHSGRTREDERVYAIIQGMAICDLALAITAIDGSSSCARRIGLDMAAI